MALPHGTVGWSAVCYHAELFLRKQDTDVYARIPCPLHNSFTFEGFSVTVVQLS